MALLICGSTAAHDAARIDVNDVCPLLEVDGAVDVAVVEVFERGGSPSEAILLSERIVRVAVYSKLTALLHTEIPPLVCRTLSIALHSLTP